ncbi:GNAT family N-acetyltransferase [Jidongwangia harbinensis]|uniref:GNAT family N-acetyltransferase n=1 Tax=Jidongwangia harbinensis TaxID=2878561 RepID=UPI001CDA018B|nr:GNAT family protein [Jidongwangia harbinensis]MCA2218432.1 GNAT family N-acetyltransferase [Jidongwangia harbinensis]
MLSNAVQLRPLTVADWAAVHDWARRPEVCRYQTWGPNTPEQTRAFVQAAVDAWAQHPPVRFVFAVVSGEQVVGNAELKLRGAHIGEIGYGVHPRVWGRGIATETARHLLGYGFRQHHLHRIFATCDPRNAASGRVLRKIGMTYEGRMREAVLIRDGWRDSDLYAILRHEWHPADQPAGSAGQCVQRPVDVGLGVVDVERRA